jgi:hypothetical protein
MANTQKSKEFRKKSSVRHVVLHEDAFTFRDGHFVGHDGFIVPNSFAEFHERFPTYVADWMRRRVDGCVSASEAEDWTQELLLHLATLPTDSIYRERGMEDVIQTFAPERMHGANEARFRSFIDQCLANKSTPCMQGGGSDRSRTRETNHLRKMPRPGLQTSFATPTPRIFARHDTAAESNTSRSYVSGSSYTERSPAFRVCLASSKLFTRPETGNREQRY